MGSHFFVADGEAAKNVTWNRQKAELKEKAKLALELVEEARLFYINTQAQVSFNLLGPVIGALLILGFIWFLYNGMPSFLAEMGNAFSGLLGGGGGGYGKHKRVYGSSGGNYNYDDYYDDIYTPAAAEHYEAKEEVKDIMRAASSQHPDTVRPGHAFYGGEFAKPGGHLVHRAVAGLA